VPIVSRLYIFCVCFFLAVAPQGEIFLGIISELHTKFFGISDCFFTGPGKFPPSSLGGGGDISEEELPRTRSLKKKKHCQSLDWVVKFFLTKLVSLAKSLSATALLRSPKIVCARLDAALSSHTCVRCVG
jgi:hypothetical protein